MRTPHRSLLFALVAGLLLASASLPSARSQSNPRTRNVYVTVTDKSGAPAKDLTPADFTIREDNQAREVLEVTQAKAPMRIALLVDNSQATTSVTNESRIAMSGFINTIFKGSPDSTLALWTFGDRPTLIENFTNAAPILVRQAQKLFPMSGSGRQHHKRRQIVAFTS